jgi:amino acid adenylation domain-containing protein
LTTLTSNPALRQVDEISEILDSLATCGVSIWAEGSRIRFRALKTGFPSELKERLAAHKSGLLAAWRQRAASQITSHVATHAQRALWFLQNEAPDSPAYNIAIPVRVFSKIDVSALEKACQALIDRHPSLRTTYAMDGTSLVQRVHGHMPVSFRMHDRAGVDLQVLRKEIIESSHAPFCVETGPVIRVDLFTRAEDDHILLIAVHHIAVDGWSGTLLMDDLRLNYIAETNPGAAPPPRPENDALVYARWQQSMLSSPEGQKHENYWTHALAGELPVLDLPTDWPRSATGTVCGASLAVDLGEVLSEEVRALAMASGTTAFVVLLAAYHSLLHRYTGSEQTIVGTPTYGRDRVEFANVIGDFVNTIPLKADFQGDPTFHQLLAQMRDRVLEGLDHQDYPFSLIVEKLQPARHPSRTPIFQTLFILQRYKTEAALKAIFSHAPGEARIDFGGLAVESFAIPHNEGQFDVTLELVDVGGVYQGHLKYKADLFSVDTVSAFADHYIRLLGALVATPDTRISRAPLLSPAEQSMILREWNDTARDYPRDVCLHELITAQVDRTPDAIAVVFEGQRLTYRELDRRANQLAHYLQKRGVTAETRVGICLDRSVEMIIGLLGILKAGAAYVPLDPSYPKARLAFMLDDTGAGILLSQKHLEPLLQSASSEIVWLDADWKHIANESKDRPEQRVRANHLAYVIYTSGSTGRPKGALIEHRSVVNQLLWMQDKFQLTASDAFLQKAPFSFDASVWEFFMPLLAGARLVIARPEGQKDPGYLIDIITSEQVTIIHFVPSMLRIFLGAAGVERCTSLRDVLGAGEALPLDLVARFHACSAATLHNLYGPTETTVSVLSWTFPRHDDRAVVPIGRPAANTQCYILDRNLQPVPVGVPGELYIGGIQVGRGYHNRPELTAERYIPDPFNYESHGRLYKSGDLCRFRRDGSIEFLGRIDQQVKIRGFRIELGEIETALKTNPDIRESTVCIREDVPGEQRLVAYFTPRNGAQPSGAELKAALRSSLPEYMVPTIFVQMESMPLSPNGKLNRNALPVPMELPVSQGHTEPRDAVERMIADAWRDVLGLEKIGMHDNFFDLGGHSLSAVRLLANLRAAFQLDLPLRCIFLDPTVAGLAKKLRYDVTSKCYQYESASFNYRCLVPAQPHGTRRPLFLVAGGYESPEDTNFLCGRIFPHLGPDQPLYGLKPRWVDGEGELYADVNEEVSDYLTELRAVQPHGPYLIAGYCICGIVALEMARQLMAQGEEIGLLALIDTERPTGFRIFRSNVWNSWLRARQRSRRLASVVVDFFRLGDGSKRDAAIGTIRRKIRGVLHPSQQPVVPANNFRSFAMHYKKTIRKCAAGNYPGRITLIVNEQFGRLNMDLGWSGFPASDLLIKETQGDHITMFKDYGRALADVLMKSIDEAMLGLAAPRHSRARDLFPERRSRVLGNGTGSSGMSMERNH